MVLKLVGFKILRDKDDESLIKGYTLYFLRDSKLNGDNEHGNVVKSIFVFPQQISGVHLSVGKDYSVFTVYDSSSKRELFAGMLECKGV